ncbi:hypothetical protein RhiJN_28166 [Ceratobasidium sp. AG-Ba]|nr:hypothetical protein RhiJN_28166 [Ceratobasidium sp. AG-Ba]
MPANTAPKKGLVIAKKGGTAAATSTKKAAKPNNKRKKPDIEHGESDGFADDGRANPASNDSNDVDMELIRAAFASAKSKHTKKQDAEFLRQQKELVDSAREQAKVIQNAGNAQLKNIIEQFESLCEIPDNSDIAAFASPVGSRSDIASNLCRDSSSQLEQVAADYEEAIQAAAEELEGRAAYREKIRRRAVDHVHDMLARGVEEQRLVTDATEIVKNFQRLMKM